MLKGLEDTLNYLNDYDIDYIGSGLNKNDSKIKYFTKNGLKIAILNFAENEWSTSV